MADLGDNGRAAKRFQASLDCKAMSVPGVPRSQNRAW